MICSIDSLMGKLELRYTQLMIGVLTNFQWVHWSRNDGTFKARVYIMCTDRILKDSGKKIRRPSFMRKENGSELEPPTIYLQTDLKVSLKKRRDWYIFLEFNAVCTVLFYNKCC
jgi:hypothetical protein